MLAWVAGDKKLVALDGAGRAASGATADRYLAKNLKSMPGQGIDSAVTPGAVDGWDTLLKAYGAMTFKEVFEPAARIAEDGFGVTERIAGEWQRAPRGCSDPDTKAVYLPGGKPPALYSVFRNPDLAKAFRLMQKEGRDAFYKGDIAKAIVAKSQAVGGTFTLADFGQDQGPVGDPADHQLSRLRHLPDAAQHPGHRRHRGAQHRRAVRAQARHRTA